MIELQPPILDVVGKGVKAKILFFFFCHPMGDYNKSEIARYCKVSRQSVNDSIGSLIRFKLIKETRKIANTTLYTMNSGSPTEKALRVFHNELVRIIVEEEREECENDPDFVLRSVDEVKELLKDELYGFDILDHPSCYGKCRGREVELGCNDCDFKKKCQKYADYMYRHCPECGKQAVLSGFDEEGRRIGEECENCHYKRGDV